MCKFPGIRCISYPTPVPGIARWHIELLRYILQKYTSTCMCVVGTQVLSCATLYNMLSLATVLQAPKMCMYAMAPQRGTTTYCTLKVFFTHYIIVFIYTIQWGLGASYGTCLFSAQSATKKNLIIERGPDFTANKTNLRSNWLGPRYKLRKFS